MKMKKISKVKIALITLTAIVALVVVKVLTAQFLYTEKGSPRLILEGGHWCDECERKSWNYGMRARKDKFFAQVWNPLHDEDEIREYPKTVSELEV